MRGDRSGHVRGGTRKRHDHLAANVEAGEVVMVLLRDRQAVAREDHLGFNALS